MKEHDDKTAMVLDAAHVAGINIGEMTVRKDRSGEPWMWKGQHVTVWETHGQESWLAAGFAVVQDGKTPHAALSALGDSLRLRLLEMHRTVQ